MMSLERKIVLNDVQMLKLVELYKENEVLWKINDKYYKDQGARTQALTRIREKLGVPELTLNDLRLKINNLRSSYTKEIRRKASCERSGTSYHPKLTWYKLADSFLRNYVYRRHVDEEMLDTENDVDANKELENEADEDEDSNTPIQFEALKDLLTKNDSQHNSHYILPETLQLRIKTETDDNEQGEASNMTKGYDTNDDDVTNSGAIGSNSSYGNRKNDPPFHRNRQDEYDAFANYIAATLRNMPRKHYIIAKSLIQNTITDIELKIYNGEE